MDYAFQTDNAINELTKFKVSYSETFNTYQFNNKWINEIDEYYYYDKIDNIKKLLHKQLVNGLKHVEYLQNLLDLIWDKIEHIEKYKCHSPKFFNLYSEKIRIIDNYNKKPATNIGLFEKFKSGSEPIDSKESGLFNFLEFHSENINKFETQFDFEKGMLLHSVHMYCEALKNLYDFIYSIHMNAEFIDFKNLKLEDLEEYSPKKRKNRVCHVNFNKKGVALLFSILLEEKIFVLDEFNMEKNRYELKQFVEENFTYRNANNERLPIKTFKREYSEAISVDSKETKKQKEFLDKLIFKLQTRRNNTKD